MTDPQKLEKYEEEAARAVMKHVVVEKLRQCKLDYGYDAEKAHAIADDLLVTFLTDLGYKDIVEAYQAIHKWYA